MNVTRIRFGEFRFGRGRSEVAVRLSDQLRMDQLNQRWLINEGDEFAHDDRWPNHSMNKDLVNKAESTRYDRAKGMDSNQEA